MGHKVNPHGLRVGVIKDWDSRWFAKDNAFGDILVEDYQLRKYLKKRLYDAGVPKIELEGRVSFRRAMKQAIGRAMKFGARGIKVQVSGRLGGAEIARTEHYHEGTIPLQTLRADIDYGFAEAATTYGRIGVKVWIYAGEVLQEARQPRKEGGSR